MIDFLRATTLNTNGKYSSSIMDHKTETQTPTRWIVAHAFKEIYMEGNEAFMLRNYKPGTHSFELHTVSGKFISCHLMRPDLDAHLHHHELITSNIADGYARDYEPPFPLQADAAQILMAAFPGRSQQLANCGAALLYLPKNFAAVPAGGVCLAVVPLNLAAPAAIFRSNSPADKDTASILQMFQGMRV